MNDIQDIINQYGFPITAAGGMAYCIYYVWTWVTTVIKPELNKLHTTTIDLIDKIRILEQDIMRLNEKINITAQLKKKKDNDE